MARLVVCLAVVVCSFLAVSASDFQRTVVAIARPTFPGQYLYLRGGDSIYGAPISIINNLTVHNRHSVYAQTSRGDNRLNWGGPEPGQGSYSRNGHTVMAEGTPMIWTTNDRTRRERVEKDGHGFTELNYMGEHVWMADFYMNCSQTHDGWFDFKGFMTDLRPGKNGEGWESHFIRQNMCRIDGVEIPTVTNQQNHRGKCGYFNFVVWSSGDCNANRLTDHMMAFRDTWIEDNSLELP